MRSNKHHKGDNYQKKQKEQVPKSREDASNRSTYHLPPTTDHLHSLPSSRVQLLRRISLPRKIRWTPSPVKEVARVRQSKEEEYTNYTPLNAPRETIYLAIRDKGLLKKPDPMKLPADWRNMYKYYDFHEDVGHNTLECFNPCN